MQIIHLILGHLISCYPSLFNAISLTQSQILTDVTYEELKELNGTCGFGREHCNLPRYSYEEASRFTCNCNRFCANLRTCCVDSPFRDLTPSVEEPICTTIFGQPLNFKFIIDKCPAETEFDIKVRCKTGWRESDNHFLPLIPVTSLTTNMTYKNYFCFRCNEHHDKYIYWNAILYASIESDAKINNTGLMPVYDSSKKSWMAALGQDGALVNITLESNDPEEVWDVTKSCLADMISNCSENWKDDVIRLKCHSYALFTFFTRSGTYISYKNPHCALCNFEDLNEKECSEYYAGLGGMAPFPFSLLLDINRSDSDSFGKIQNLHDNST